MLRNTFDWLLLACLTVLTLFLPGCGNGPAKQPAARAEAAVEEFLDSWSRGVSPDGDRFAGANQPIQATDPDWKAGCRLLSFLSIEAKPDKGAPDHVRCRVALSLMDRKGKKVDKEVVYDVQVGDKSVITRAPR